MAELSMVCTRDVHTPTEARCWVTAAVEDQVDGVVLEALRMIVTELVTNAVRHGLGRIELCVAVQSGQARVEVTDEGTDCDVVVIPVVSDGPGGRGLRLVDAYADRWGCNAGRGDKMVWAEVDLRRANAV